MKIVGHPISFRLPGRVSELRNRLSRARYFRGHGVHSPFVYDIVRSVFMRDDLLPGRRDLYEALLTAGVSRRRAGRDRRARRPWLPGPCDPSRDLHDRGSFHGRSCGTHMDRRAGDR